MTFDKDKILNYCNQISENTLMRTLNIKFTDAGVDFLVATMPVNPTVHQPMGLLHGGASVALAESVVTATAKIVHKGRSIHLWEIRITDESDNLISLCKLTNMILPKRKIEGK